MQNCETQNAQRLGGEITGYSQRFLEKASLFAKWEDIEPSD